MSNKFADFLNDYTFVYKTNDALNSLPGLDTGDFKFKSGGNGTLSTALHKKVRLAVDQLIDFRNNNRWEHDRLIEEKKVKRDLQLEMTNLVDMLTIISEKSEVKADGVALMIVERIYDPLYNTAKEIYGTFSETFEVK